MEYIKSFDRSLHNLESYPPPNLSFLEALAVFDKARHELRRDENSISEDELEDLSETAYDMEADEYAKELANPIPALDHSCMRWVRRNTLCRTVLLGLEYLIPAAKEKLKESASKEGKNFLKNALPALISHYEEYSTEYTKNKNWDFHKEKPYIVKTLEETYFVQYIQDQVLDTNNVVLDDVQTGKRKKPAPRKQAKSKKQKRQSSSDTDTTDTNVVKIDWDYDKLCMLIRLMIQKKAELGNDKFVKGTSYSQIASEMMKAYPTVPFTDDKCRSAYSRQLSMYQAYKKVDNASGIGDTNDVGVVRDFCKKNKLYEKFFDLVTGDRYPMYETFPTYDLMCECVGNHHFTGDRMYGAEEFISNGEHEEDLEVEEGNIITLGNTEVSNNNGVPPAPAFPQLPPRGGGNATNKSPALKASPPQIKGKKSSMLNVAEHLGGALDSFANTFATTVTSAVQVLAMPPPHVESPVRIALHCFTNKDKYSSLCRMTEENKVARIAIEDHLSVEANAVKFLSICMHTTAEEDEKRMLSYVNDRIL